MKHRKKLLGLLAVIVIAAVFVGSSGGSSGKVLVGIRRRGSRVRLDVIDTGIGFNKDQHKLLFAEFSRLERGARHALIGLLDHRLVGQHLAQVEAERPQQAVGAGVERVAEDRLRLVQAARHVRGLGTLP